MSDSERKKIQSAVETLDAGNFESVALQVFRYQAAYNPLYAQFLQLLKKDLTQVHSLYEIPCLPISFFKSRALQTGVWNPEAVFASSSTTGQVPSQHLVRDKKFYLNNALKGFEAMYGSIRGWRILALLPAYLERTGSSLVAMADAMIVRSEHPDSGFFLHDLAALRKLLLQDCETPTLLLGVSFALLDLAEQGELDLKHVVIMETGGMKGRRRELTRTELHEILCRAFRSTSIHSEYGMTELFSQAYAKGGNWFEPCTTLRVYATEIQDPFFRVPFGRTGQLNCIDLANIDTCAFIKTDDLCKVKENHTFEVLGRLDTAELRGCNLMVE